MKILKEYHEKNRQELLESLRKNKIMMMIHSFMGLVLFVGGYLTSSLASWKIGEFVLIGSVVLFIVVALDFIEHSMLNILLSTKKEK